MSRALVAATLMLGVLFAGCISGEERTQEAGGGQVGDTDFTFTPANADVGQKVTFTPHSGKADLVGIVWDFGDGATHISSNGTQLQAVQHAYDAPGIYTVVMLAVWDGGQKDVSHVLNVGTIGKNGPVIVATDLGGQWQFSYNWSQTPTTVSWDFGDGKVSSLDNPIHTYTDVGVYRVVLSTILNSTIYTTSTTITVSQVVVPATFFLSDVGYRGPEPSVGVTSSGCIFFAALQNVMRSCDAGASWVAVQDVFSQPTTSDPYLWVDPITDRIFNVQMVVLVGTWVAWSDDDGETWLGNPYDQGPLPVNDHIKLASGPWTTEGYGAIGQGTTNIYETATYFCYNKLIGVYCYTSFDGGMTFPVGGTLIGQAGSGGLHGAITTAPDGTVYVPPRSTNPSVHMSKDNGLTWTQITMGQDVGTTSPRKNSEVATDSESNAYHTWIGADEGVYLARSTDSGLSWDEKSIRVSSPAITSATFPHIDAGTPGRIGIAYLGSENYAGSAQVAEDTARYDLYYTYSNNALDANPTWVTTKITDDPVQIGSICLNSGACSNGNRNLLDFNDLHIDKDGRVYIAYADGCTGQCAEDPLNAVPGLSRDARGMVAILETGPSLLEEVGDLLPLPRTTA